MAIATVAAYKALGNRASLEFMKTPVAAYDAAKHYSLWTAAPNAGAAPTTAAACDYTTAGAMLNMPATSASALWLRSTSVWTAEGPCIMQLCDRLSHQGGLSGTAAGAQTTNLPTAALTRYTSGDGVRGLVEVYSQIGATQRLFSVSYTDQSGNAGATSPNSAIFGGTVDRDAKRCFDIPLAAGDSGIRSVESLTLSASTGSVGNYGITLYKPLSMFYIVGRDRRAASYDEYFNKFRMTEIKPGACLFWKQISPALTTATLVDMGGVLEIVEG